MLGPVKPTFKRANTTVKNAFEAKKMKRDVASGAGLGQMVPMDISTKSGTGTSKLSVLSRRSGSGYYYDKWNFRTTRTDPVYPRPEVKDFDNNIGVLGTEIQVTSAGDWYSLNDIPRGTDSMSRVGRQIANKSVYYQFVLNLGTVVPAVPCAVRHMIIYDRQSNQANPTVGTFFADPSNPLTSPMDMSYKSRYIIIADDRTTLSPNGDSIRIVKNFYRINLNAMFGDQTNEGVTGNVVVFLVSDRVSGTSAPVIYGTWRLKFIDN